MTAAKKLLYVGPSWAARSFDTPGGEETDFTTLYQELNLNVTDLSQPGASNMEMIDRVRNAHNNYDGVIWVFGEPLSDPTWNEDSLSELIESEDFWSLRKNIYDQTMFRINDEIKKPIAMIGAHSDVTSKVDDMTVIHHSWQKFLAQAVGVNIAQGWGADVLHRMIMTEVPKARPSITVVDAVADQFRSWKQMELRRVFNWVHPTALGNQMFAQQIKPKLYQWIDQL